MASRPSAGQLGLTVRIVRERAGWSLDDLADALNMSPDYLSMVERGIRRLNTGWSLIDRIADDPTTVRPDSPPEVRAAKAAAFEAGLSEQRERQRDRARQLRRTEILRKQPQPALPDLIWLSRSEWGERVAGRG